MYMGVHVEGCSDESVGTRKLLLYGITHVFSVWHFTWLVQLHLLLPLPNWVYIHTCLYSNIALCSGCTCWCTHITVTQQLRWRATAQDSIYASTMCALMYFYRNLQQRSTCSESPVIRTLIRTLQLKSQHFTNANNFHILCTYVLFYPGSEMCPTKRTTDGCTSRRCAISRSVRRNIRGETPLHIAAIKVRLVNSQHMHSKGYLVSVCVCVFVRETISQKQ